MSQPSSVPSHQNGVTKQRAFYKTHVMPPLDVYENAEELLVVVDLPGVTANDLSIEVLGDALKLFDRTIRIPAGIDAERITAEARSGTVVIHMPKVEAAKPRKIPVKIA